MPSEIPLLHVGVRVGCLTSKNVWETVRHVTSHVLSFSQNQPSRKGETHMCRLNDISILVGVFMSSQRERDN